MARILHDDQGGSSSSGNSSSEGQLTIIQADGQSQIALSDGDFMSKGDILRDGQDLILQSSDGSEIVIEGYFSALTPPLLTTPHGSSLTPELVQSFVKSEGPVEYAASGTETDASAVGIVKEVSGDATVTRTDGSTEKVTLGMDIHQGDIIETTGAGAVNIVFLDESSFAITNDARLAIDEYVFDPATQAGETNVSILRGMFVFTSGLIGRDDPDDVTIETPVGSIGIRGTTIAGRISPDGESQVTVVEGAIVIKNGVTEITLAEQYETVTLTGFDQQIQMAGTLDSGQMQESYGMLGTVNAGFFNTLNVASESVDSETLPDESVDVASVNVDPQISTTAAPAAETQQAEVALDPVPVEGQLDTEAQKLATTDETVVVSYDIFTDPMINNFDSSVMLQPTATFTTSQFTTQPIQPAPLPGTSMSLASADTTLSGTTQTTTTIMALGTTTTETALLPPLSLIVNIFVDDDAVSGSVVGRAFTTLPYPGAVMTLLRTPVDANSDALFHIVYAEPGVYNVILTAAGEAVADAAALNSTLGVVEVSVTLGDGRTQIAAAPANYGDFSSLAVVITPPPTLNLNGISGSNGYSLVGDGGSGLGNAAAHLGDFDRNGTNNFAMTTAAVTGSVVINGIASVPKAGDSAGMQIAAGGDVNGDGRLDFVTGRAYFDGGATDNGQVNIHSGVAPGTASITNGAGAADLFGSSVAMVDFNGNGYADVFAGAQTAGGAQGAVSYFSGFNGFGFTTAGFAGFATGSAGNQLGLSMTGLSDYNNDGFGDVAVGANGFVNIYLGNSGGAGTADFLITGIPIDGTYDMPLFNLGDVNGDGWSDLMIGATGANGNNGAAYVSFGGSGGVVNFTIDPAAGEEIVGGGSAGDFNGDGFDDIFIATRNGSIVDGYVIYGTTGFSDITLDSSWMANNPGAGFRMRLDLTTLNVVGSLGMTATSIGDQNGDGFEDMLLSSSELNSGAGGAYIVYGRADPYDLAGPNPNVHAVGINAPLSGAVASSNGDGLVGDNAANTFNNNGFSGISFRAGAGNDIISLSGTGSNLARVIDGGHGGDELRLFTTGNVDFRNISEMEGIEKIAFTGAASQSMTIGLNDVFSLLQTSGESFNAGAGGRYSLVIANDGAGAKQVTFDDANNNTSLSTAGFAASGTYSDGPNVYDVYTFGSGYQLLIEQGITITVN